MPSTMTIESALSQIENEQTVGMTLVKRFTDELEGQTTLERAAIHAREKQNALVEQQMDERRRAMFEDKKGNDAIFHAVETARLALVKTHQMLEMPEQQSRFKTMVHGKKAARGMANEALRGKTTYGFAPLRDYVSSLESEWKNKQWKPAQRFRSICRGLDDHGKAFEIFPSSNDYASALCGSLKFIIAAAVNHEEIAETISETTTKITEKAARVAKTLNLFETDDIRALFSNLYEQVFLFYRDAMEWYMKSKAARFIGSFNEKMKERYEKAAANIDFTIKEMYHETDLAHFAFVRVHLTDPQRRNGVSLQRKQTIDQDDLSCAGHNAQQLLLGSYKSACVEASNARHTQEYKAHDAQFLHGQLVVPARSNLVLRAAAKKLAVGTEKYIVGDEGHSFFNDGGFWLPNVDVASRLYHWIGNERDSSTLWITSLEVSQAEAAGSRAAALNALVAAWTAELPVISHFCKRPRYATLAQGREVEKVGLIGLVYSLIAQLLQFEFEDDAFEIPQEQIESLNGSDESWPDALNILSTLLKATPHLGTCIIDGLNDLSFSEGSEWCNAFLGMLFAHQKSSTNIFRILLTTAGRSRVLQDHVGNADHFLTQTEAEEIIRDGQWYKMPKS